MNKPNYKTISIWIANLILIALCIVPIWVSIPMVKYIGSIVIAGIMLLNIAASIKATK